MAIGPLYLTAVLGAFFILFTFGNTANDYCMSFNCAEFLGHMLLIKKDYDAETYCTLELNIKVGDTITCPSGATATVINSSYVLLKTQETHNFLMEYGIDNKTHGDVCRSIRAGCPKTDYPKTENKENKEINKDNKYWYWLLLFFSVPFIICIVTVIRNRKRSHGASKTETLIKFSTTSSEPECSVNIEPHIEITQ